MASPRLEDEVCVEAVKAWLSCGKSRLEAASQLGLHISSFNRRLSEAAKRGLTGYGPVQPGFSISQISEKANNGAWVKQRPEAGPEFVMPEGQMLKGISVLTDSENKVHWQWTKTSADTAAVKEYLRAAADALKETLPRIAPTPVPGQSSPDLLSQYTITDLHLGMLAWAEETRGDDYNLKIAEQLVIDWFSAAIAMAPSSDTAIFAQLGDFLHHDSLKSETPEHKNVLDADSRFQKIVRVSVRVVRQIIDMLLQKHAHVHVVMASANHDPASSAWLREMFNVVYETEPRVTVDTSPSPYYVYEWGKTALFFHHGHKRKVRDVDHVFAGLFRETFGRCPYSYGHVGHLHSNEAVETNLMTVERHRTLAPSDAHASSGGWLSKRDAKVITYHKEYGEVSRITLPPKMVSRDPPTDD